MILGGKEFNGFRFISCYGGSKFFYVCLILNCFRALILSNCIKFTFVFFLHKLSAVELLSCRIISSSVNASDVILGFEIGDATSFSLILIITN